MIRIRVKALRLADLQPGAVVEYERENQRHLATVTSKDCGLRGTTHQSDGTMSTPHSISALDITQIIQRAPSAII